MGCGCVKAQPSAELVGHPDTGARKPAPRIFLSDEYSKQKLLESLTKEELADQQRILEWWELLRAGGLDHSNLDDNKDEIREKVLHGVPKRFLGSAWKAFARTAESFRPGGYERLWRVAERDDDLAAAIGKDLPRTFPSHSYFDDAGQQQLKRILGAYAVACPQVGYVQGVNFIAGFILATLQQEEDSFWIFVRLMNHMGVAGLFVERTPGVRLFKALFAALLTEHLPDLDEHLEVHEVAHDLFVTKWILSMFSYSIPFEAAVAIWGIVFTDGIESLIVAALGLLKLLRTRLLASKSGEEMKQVLNDLQPAMGFTGKDVVKAAIGMQVRADMMEKERRKWMEKHAEDGEILERAILFDAENVTRAPYLRPTSGESKRDDPGGEDMDSTGTGFRPSSRPPPSSTEAADSDREEAPRQLCIVTKADKAFLGVEALPDWSKEVEEPVEDPVPESVKTWPERNSTKHERVADAPFAAEFGPSPKRHSRRSSSPEVKERTRERPASWEGSSGGMLGLAERPRAQRPSSAQAGRGARSPQSGARPSADTTTAEPETPPYDGCDDAFDEEVIPDEVSTTAATSRAAPTPLDAPLDAPPVLRGPRAASEPRGGPLLARGRSRSAEPRPRSTGPGRPAVATGRPPGQWTPERRSKEPGRARSSSERAIDWDQDVGGSRPAAQSPVSRVPPDGALGAPRGRSRSVDAARRTAREDDVLEESLEQDEVERALAGRGPDRLDSPLNRDVRNIAGLDASLASSAGSPGHRRRPSPVVDPDVGVAWETEDPKGGSAGSSLRRGGGWFETTPPEAVTTPAWGEPDRSPIDVREPPSPTASPSGDRLGVGLPRTDSETSLVREDSGPSDAVSYLPVVSPRSPDRVLRA